MSYAKYLPIDECCEAPDCDDECQCEAHSGCDICQTQCGCVCDELYENWKDSQYE